MSRHTQQEYSPSERRKFERVDIAAASQVLVLEPEGRKAGTIRQIGRGGFMMVPEKTYTKDNKAYRFTIHEQEEEIHVEVSARVLYADSELVGFQFVDLNPDAAVEVGIIIGKYYEAEHGKS
jgi:hypothetical protein